MAVARYFHLAYYLIYLIVYTLFLYFFLYYLKVPVWVFWILFAGIIIIGVGVIQKETLMKRRLKEDGSEVCQSTRRNWTIAYTAFHIIALALIITGIVFVIIYAKGIPAWVWIIMFVGFILSIVGAMIHAYSPEAKLWAAIVHFIALALGLVGFVFLIYYSIVNDQTPYWVWLLYALAILFGVLAGSFEHVSEKNQTIVKTPCDEQCNQFLPCDDECEIECESPCAQPCPQPCPQPYPQPCPQPCGETMECSKKIRVSNLPGSDIMEQTIP